MTTESVADVLREHLAEGIPSEIPPMPPDDPTVDHAPPRRQVLSEAERRLALDLCVTPLAAKSCRRRKRHTTGSTWPTSIGVRST